MNSGLRKYFLGILIGYGIILGGLFYWQLCADLNNHVANPRYYQMFQEQRGTIYDRNGKILAFSKPTENGKFKREYATPSLAHVVGYFHQRYGITGLENVYHQELVKGRNLYTTIDLEYQKLAEEALGDQQGAIIVLDPRTGEILAMVSSPTVDGNLLDENWSDYINDSRSPFLNRATQGQYPPGSVIKPIVYGAALEKGLIEAGESWDDQGFLAIQDRIIRNYGTKALGTITVDQALAKSSNVVFAQLAMLLAEDLLNYYRSFGLGKQVNFILSNHNGYIPAKIASQYDAALLGIGQGEFLVTPLQIAGVVGAIANRGQMMQPFIVKEVRGGLRLRQITRPQVINDILSESVTLIIRDAMELTVREGTAQERFSDKLHLAAKTGTAQTNQGADHAWFVAFAPSRMPQVAVVVLVEHGGAGSVAAAPIGARIIGKALEDGRARKVKGERP